jgi:hypothetical protein
MTIGSNCMYAHDLVHQAIVVLAFATQGYGHTVTAYYHNTTKVTFYCTPAWSRNLKY